MPTPTIPTPTISTQSFQDQLINTKKTVTEGKFQSDLFDICEEQGNLCLNAACLFDIHLYLTPLGQARQFIESCGTLNPLCGK
jgi:hypothetical protein